VVFKSKQKLGENLNKEMLGMLYIDAPLVYNNEVYDFTFKFIVKIKYKDISLVEIL